jgi:cytochrome b561
MFNTKTSYGIVAIVLHWLMAIVILGTFGLGWYMVELTYYDKLYKTLPFIHKSIGISLALVFIIRVGWKLINPVPESIPSLSQFEKVSSKLVHLTFYGLITLIVISGYLISTADNSSISVFDLFEVPATITEIPEQEDTAGLVHKILTYSLIGLVVLHAAAALKHHFVNRDDTLRRMLGVKLAHK